MRIIDEQLEIMWLCFGCPEVTPLPDCKLQKYRNEIVTGKTEMVERLSFDEAVALIKNHKVCLRKRKHQRIQ